MSISNKDVRNYILGNANHLLDKIGLLPEEVEIQVKTRQEICKPCENLQHDENGQLRCILCTCKWPGLTYALAKKCDADKWQEIKK